MLVHRLKRTKLFAALLLLAVAAFPHPSRAADPVIQPEDVISIVVSGEPTLSKEYTVNSSGDITMEMIGKSRVAGLTAVQAQNRITQQLRKYLKLFDVKVTMAGENSMKVLVFGEVTKPGPVKLGSNGKLLDALSEAGPLTANADPKRISILRKGVEKPELYDLDSVSNDRALNAALRAGDTITVPAKGSYTVQIDGEVRTAGMRSLDSANTLAAAVLAAGPNENADWSRVLLRRKGSAIPEEVDLSQVRAGTAKDEITLQPGDQITVLSRVLGNAKVIGEVKTSGDKPITGKTFLLDFIGTAGGGFSEKADPMRVEIRRPGQEPRTFDLMPVMRGEKISTDPEMEIRPGDTVFVPNGEKTRFHIVGGVNKGGSFPVQPGMNLIDAITMAEGFKPSATKKALVIAPDDPNDERLKTNAAPVKKSKKKSAEAAPAQGLIVVDLKKLIDGDGAQNVEIKQGDQILVPEDGVPIQREKVPFIDRVLRMLPLYGLFSGR